MNNSKERPTVTANHNPPAWKLATNRSVWKMLLLGIITLGIYPMIIYYYMYEDINILASRHDGKRTMHPIAMSFLCVVTLGIFYFVWMHKLCRRIGDELDRRHINYSFGPKYFWLLDVLCGGILYIPILPALYEALRISTNNFQISYNSTYNYYYNYMNNFQPSAFQNLPLFAVIWGIAATVVIAVCHLIFVHKYCKAMNCLAVDYNKRG